MIKPFLRLVDVLIAQPLSQGDLLRSLVRTPAFLLDFRRYQQLSRGEAKVRDWYPCLHDKTATTPFEPHYFFQSAWAARKIAESHPTVHVDVGSQINLIAPLSAFVPVEFVEIRPLAVCLSGLKSVTGSILKLPYSDQSVHSISSLHVIEHIGLGRYGDPLDPEGTYKACRELSRVLAVGGNLYITVPIGRHRIEFNAHRIVEPKTIIRYCDGLELVDFSIVDDKGSFHEHVSLSNCHGMSYGAGLFHFSRKESLFLNATSFQTGSQVPRSVS